MNATFNACQRTRITQKISLLELQIYICFGSSGVSLQVFIWVSLMNDDGNNNFDDKTAYFRADTSRSAELNFEVQS